MDIGVLWATVHGITKESESDMTETTQMVKQQVNG